MRESVVAAGYHDGVHDFRRLRAWQRARVVVGVVYEATAEFPVEERFGLQSQMRRAAVSVTSNVAEGSGRRTPNDFARFLSMATGSVSELDSLILVAGDLGYLDKKVGWAIQSELSILRQMIYSLAESHGASL